MKGMIIDFYSGFEGEPEIVFFCEEKSLRIWGGYFSSLIRKIPSNPETGEWEGITYYYHLCLGWGSEDSWEIPDMVKIKEQFDSIVFAEEEEEDVILLQIRNEIVSLLNNAIQKEQSVYISEE